LDWLTRVACVLIFVIGLASFGPSAEAQVPPLEIPVLLPMTGVAAFFGQDEAASLGALERLTNEHGGIKGRTVKFVVQDDQSNPSLAVQYVNALIARKVPIVLGPSFTAECLAVAPLIKTGPVQYCISPGIIPSPGGYTYSAGIAGADYVTLYLRYFRAKHFNKVALITSTDASGQAFEGPFDQFMARDEFKSLRLVDREHFNVSDLSVDAQMARIKAADPDVVIEWTAGTAFATLLRGTQNVGLDVPIAGGSGNMTYTQMKQYAAFLPKQLLFSTMSVTTRGGIGPGPVHDAQTVYFDALKAAGVQADFQTAIIWDPASLIIEAYRALGTDATADGIQRYLQHLHGWTGITGVYDFRDGSQRGVGVGAGVVARWDDREKDFIALTKLGGYPK
jgi:branched-chain amino acid transport system substrate-binding protein